MRRVNVISGLVTTLAGNVLLNGGPPNNYGYADGAGPSSSFYRPVGVAMNSAGTLAVVVRLAVGETADERSRCSRNYGFRGCGEELWETRTADDACAWRLAWDERLTLLMGMRTLWLACTPNTGSITVLREAIE